MPLTVNIDGASQIEALLKQMPERVARNVVNHSLMQGAAVVVRELKNDAPVGVYGDGGVRKVPTRKRQKFGSLASNIRRKTLKVGGASMTVGVGIGRAFWGLFDEFGTHHQPARPWFRRAWEAVKLQALDAIGKDLGKSVEREALKLAGETGTKKAKHS
jgi:HK97 gp10 family phage protein